MLSIPTGDWINIATVIGLVAILIGLVRLAIAWRIMRRPATTIIAGSWEAEPHSSAEDHRRRLVVRAPISFSPSGTSFQVIDIKCEAKGEVRRPALTLVSPELSEVYQSGKTLVFVFREEGDDKSAFPHPIERAQTKISVRLADGTKFHERQEIRFGPSTVHVRGSYEPNRTPPEMARYALHKARAWTKRTWRDSFVMRTWNNLRHG